MVDCCCYFAGFQRVSNPWSDAGESTGRHGRGPGTDLRASEGSRGVALGRGTKEEGRAAQPGTRPAAFSPEGSRGVPGRSREPLEASSGACWNPQMPY